MIEIKKILLPTDFSDTSREALKYAVSMAREYGSDLTILHVVNQQLLNESLNLPRIVSMQDLEREMNKEAERQLDVLLRDAPGMDNLAAKRVILLGNPAVEIVRYAKEQNVDLIVIGTHGRSGLEHVLFGSTAEKVIRKAPCPVLTVKPAQREFIVPEPG